MPDRFVNHLFWDIDRIGRIIKWIKLLVFNENIYGLTFYIFIMAILINIKNLFNKNILLLLFILMVFLLYSGIYYQLDDLKQDPLDSMMKNSFKRGLFCFVPLVLFYASTSKTIHRLFLKIDEFRISR